MSDLLAALYIIEGFLQSGTMQAFNINQYVVFDERS